MIDTKNQMLNDLNASFTKGQTYSHSELRSFLESNKLFSVKNVAAVLRFPTKASLPIGVTKQKN